MRRETGEGLERLDIAGRGRGRTVCGHGDGWLGCGMETRGDAWSAEKDNSGSTAREPGPAELEDVRRRFASRGWAYIIANWLWSRSRNVVMLQAQKMERGGGGGGLDVAARVAPGSAVAMMAQVWLVAQVTR